MLRKKLTRKSLMWAECARWCCSYSNVHRGLFPKQILTQRSLPSSPHLFQQHYLSHEHLLLIKATIAPQWTYVTLLVNTESSNGDCVWMFDSITVGVDKVGYLTQYQHFASRFQNYSFSMYGFAASSSLSHCTFYTRMTQWLSFIKAA